MRMENDLQEIITNIEGLTINKESELYHIFGKIEY